MVDAVMMQSKQTLDKVKKKYKPRTSARHEKLLTSLEPYWIFWPCPVPTSTKVETADDQNKSGEPPEEIVGSLEEVQRHAAVH